MSKVSIITRALNRLEYTAMCVRSINHLTKFDDYNHIIIDQGSTDGTRDWLNSLIKEDFYKLKIKLNDVNTGDAGGMLDGYKLLDDDCKYVMQFDNDCEVISKNYLENLVDVMDNNPKIGIIMLKRNGVGRNIIPSNLRKVGSIMVGDIPRATCCMIIRKDLLDRLNLWYNKERIGWGFAISEKILNMGYQVVKSVDVEVNHIDGGNSEIKQSQKYPSYFSKTVGTSNYTNIKY